MQEAQFLVTPYAFRCMACQRADLVQDQTIRKTTEIVQSNATLFIYPLQKRVLVHCQHGALVPSSAKQVNVICQEGRRI